MMHATMYGLLSEHANLDTTIFRFHEWVGCLNAQNVLVDASIILVITTTTAGCTTTNRSTAVVPWQRNFETVGM